MFKILNKTSYELSKNKSFKQNTQNFVFFKLKQKLFKQSYIY